MLAVNQKQSPYGIIHEAAMHESTKQGLSLYPESHKTVMSSVSRDLN